SRALFCQMTHAGLADLAGADDQDCLFRQIVLENPFRQFDRDTTHRSSPASDGSAGADFLEDLEGLLKDAVQGAAGELGAESQVVSLLHLTGDFCLAKHQRVQAGRHAEKMAGGFEVLIDISMWAEIARLGAK